MRGMFFYITRYIMIDLTKAVLYSSTPGMENTKIYTFSYSVPSQTLTTTNQTYSQSQSFAVNAGFNELYGQFQAPGLDSTWRVLSGGTSYYNYNSSNVWVRSGTNAYSLRLFTSLTNTTVAQTVVLQYQNSPNPVTVPAFTINLKVFVLKAPF